jgi:hypothetical protein
MIRKIFLKKINFNVEKKNKKNSNIQFLEVRILHLKKNFQILFEIK